MTQNKNNGPPTESNAWKRREVTEEEQTVLAKCKFRWQADEWQLIQIDEALVVLCCESSEALRERDFEELARGWFLPLQMVRVIGIYNGRKIPLITGIVPRLS